MLVYMGLTIRSRPIYFLNQSASRNAKSAARTLQIIDTAASTESIAVLQSIRIVPDLPIAKDPSIPAPTIAVTSVASTRYPVDVRSWDRR